VLNYGRLHVDIYIIGSAFGMSQLGGYSLARDLVSKVPQFLNPFYGKFLFPLMTKVKNDSLVQRRIFLFSINFVVLLNLLAYASLALLSDVVVEILYSDKGNDVSEVVMILCLFYMLRGFGVVHALLLQSTGRVRREFYWNLFATSVFSISLYYLSRLSFDEMLYGMVITQFVTFLISFFFLHYPNYIVRPRNFYSVTILGVALTLLALFLQYKFFDGSYLSSILFTLINALFIAVMFYLLSGKKEGLKKIMRIYNNE
jgi:O-antigen/teichoic acid export membrane protein